MIKRTVVLIPGLLCDATVWHHQIETLGPAFDVVVPDLTGATSIATMTAIVLALASPRLAIAGHSLGARVALEAWRLAPHRVERLALLDTGTAPVAPGEAARRAQLLEISRNHGMRALADIWLPPMVAPGRLEAEPALREAMVAMVERMSPAIHRRQIGALLDRPDATPLLQKIRCPVLVGVGELDAWSPPAQHEAMVRAIPEATYVVFERSGHMAPMEAPDAVTAALRDWLSLPEQGFSHG